MFRQMLALLLTSSMVHAQIGGDTYTGHCPEVAGTLHDQGKQLEIERLTGLWKIVYDHRDRQEGIDCYSVKFNPSVEGLNSSQYQVLFGHRTPDRQYLYDDDTYFTFNQPEQSNIALVQSKEAMDDPDGAIILTNLDEQLVPLTEERKSKMTEEEVQQYEENQEMIKSIKEQVLGHKPENQYWQVLDTDYDNYLIQYACQEHEQMFNQFGQTREDVMVMQDEDPSKSYDEQFTESRYSHVIMAAIQARQSNLSSEKLDEYIGKLKGMVKGFAFEGYIPVKHKEDCPADSEDIFLLPEAKSYTEIEQMGDMDDEDQDYSEHLEL